LSVELRLAKRCTNIGAGINTDRNISALPLAKSIGRRRHAEETRLKISRANKGKHLGCVPWNKGRKLNYIPGKREHTEETKKKMSEAAKRRWTQHQ